MTAAELVNLGVSTVLDEYLAAQYAALAARVTALEAA